MKTVDSAPGYLVDDDGNIYSKLGRLMKPRTRKDGYKQLALRVNNKYSTRLVHRLVAEAFLGADERSVNHINGVKGDNQPGNLEYATNSENQIHCFEVLGKKRKPVQLMQAGVGYWWPSQKHCSIDTGLPQTSVSALHKGVRKSALGWHSTHFEELG